jgi:hypothetical protein
MKKPLYVIFGLITATVAQTVLADAGLRLSADTPSVNVMPRNPGRGPLSLPDLEYRFNIRASCRNDTTPASLSLAVADTRRSFNSEQIASGELDDVRLTVPAAQIAPVVIADFCVAEHVDIDVIGQRNAGSLLAMRAALSAQASLMCAGENSQTITYASEALNLVLVCDNSGAPPGVQVE